LTRHYTIGVERTEQIKSVAYFNIIADSQEMAKELVLNGLCNNKSTKNIEWHPQSKENKGYKVDSYGHGRGGFFKLKKWDSTPNKWECLR
jgi:hypothetical protein